MSNLTDLLPAGGGGKNVNFVATGTLASGQTVALKADGTVEAIASDANSISQTAGAASVFESASADFTSIAYDSSVQRILISYRDQGNSNYGTAVVGTVSGSTITFGTPAIFLSAAVDSTSTANVSGDGKFVIANKGSGNGRARVATVSGTSVSFGSDATFSSANIDYAQVNYDSGNDKIVITWTDGSYEDRGTYIVGTVSGTSISFGSAADFSDSYISYLAVTYEPIQGKLVAVYGIGSNGKARVGVVSGTSMTWGASVVFEQNHKATVNTITSDSTTGQVFVAYRDSADVYGKVGTIDLTSSQWGVRDTLLTSSSNIVQTVSYHAASKKMIFSCQTGSDVKAVIITTSGTGTSASFTKTNSIALTGTGQDVSSTYDSVNGQVVLAYKGTDEFSVTTGTASTFTPAYTATNFTDFLGITNEAISNAATGEVAVQGGAITNGSLLPQLASSTFGSESVYENSESAYEAAVYDTANDKVVVAYKNTGDSQKGKVVVGTVSGTSISFGTPVDFEGSDIVTYVKAVYDPDQGKVIITWNSNSTGHHKAIVGTVSGTSISFGSAVTYEASAGINFGIVYDTSNDKVVVTFKDGSNSNYGTAIVGTVTGTSISFGTKAVIKSQNLVVVSSVFDSANNKVLISYMEDLGGGSSDRSGIVVGTVSGTSISFGAHLEFLAGQAYNQSLVHDTSSGKNVLVYRDVTNSSYGTAVVATISGTSVSLGTAAVFNDNNTGASCAMYDPTTNATFVFYKDVNSVGTAKGGIVSGTNISFGSASVFNAANPGGIISAVKDPDQNKVIVTYTDYGNSQYGTAVVGTLSNASPALTIGSTYYVQDDGSLGTTSSSVAAGRAIGSTSLLLKG